MRALRVVEPNPAINDPFRLETVCDFMQIDGLLFQRPPQAFDKDVVQIAALPSIEILILASVKVVIQPEPVYWLP